MWCRQQYDENLNNNIFLQEILKNHADLIKQASHESWIICVPRSGAFETSAITIEAILDHVLIPGSNTAAYTLNKKQVTITNKQIKTGDDQQHITAILFEETHYVGGAKYTVFCLANQLFAQTAQCHGLDSAHLETLHDCIDYLWSENLGGALGHIQEVCSNFILEHHKLKCDSLQGLKELIGKLYSECLQVALKNRPLDDCENLKLATETYMQSCLGTTLITSINTLTCQNDAHINKILNNSRNMTLKDFNLKTHLSEAITNARTELNKLNNYVTILDKINCLKNTLGHLYDTPTACITTDETLQILVFLIVKLQLSNWLSNLHYLNQFRLSSEAPNETSFVLTSLEAALRFIQTNGLRELVRPTDAPPLFRIIANGTLSQLQSLLHPHNSPPITQPKHHPLCDCAICATPTLDTAETNEHGWSPLIAATIFSRTVFVEFLISAGAPVNFRDYNLKTALHWACHNGNQPIVLILVNCRADVNLQDGDGNTPLMLGIQNGHENVVKALLYTAKNLQINCTNRNGDTPLHAAVKWNFVELTRILLENGANPNIKNKKQKRAGDFAENYYTQTLLKRFTKYTSEAPKPESPPATPRCKEHGVRPVGVAQYKKIDLLLKTIENNDFPLTCFYLGFGGAALDYQFQAKCHPLCNCPKCSAVDGDGGPSSGSPLQDPLNINTCNVDGFTPLHIAAKFGRSKIVRVLLDAGASPNLKTFKTHQTALHLACLNQQLTCVKMLASGGACDLNPSDYKGNTPLFYACCKEDGRIVEVLLENGANCDVINFQGRNVMREARERCLFGISKLLNDTSDGEII